MTAVDRSNVDQSFVPTAIIRALNVHPLQVNCKTEELEPSFYEMSPSEPYSKRRRIDTQSDSHHLPQHLQPGQQQDMTMTDIWRPYLQAGPEYCDTMVPHLKLDNTLFSEPITSQDNLISFMLKGPEDQNGHIIRDSQKLLANMSGGLQLTKL